MLNRWIHPKAHDYLHVLGMCVLAFGLPFNKVLMSIGAIWGAANLILEGKVDEYWANLKNNSLFWIFICFFGLEIIGLFWSSNWAYGLDDIRKKLPLLAVPIALCARPFKQEVSRNLVFAAFLVSVTFCSIWNTGHYFQAENLAQSSNIRELSRFISHIRFSMMVVIAIVLCIYFIQKTRKFIWFFTLLAIWLLVYTYSSQVLTGVLALFAIVYGWLHFRFFHIKPLGWGFFLLPIVLFTAFLVFIFNWNADPTNLPIQNNLAINTALGNPYYHDLGSSMKENDSFIYINICDQELETEWNKRSTVNFNAKDKNGNLIRATLYRYLTYMHQPKDAEGIKNLTQQDIRWIEMGYATRAHGEWGLKGRLADLKFQLVNQTDPNGHSLLQRLEYWQAGTKIALKHFIFGVGTGDVNDVFQAHYSATHSKLLPEYRLRSHNTYLTQFATFGVVGFLLIFYLFWKLFKSHPKNVYWYIFAWIFLFTFFVEDSLETQAGVSLFALFISLFLYQENDAQSNIL